MQASRGFVWICLILPTTVCVNTCEVISLQEALLGLGVQGFNGGASCRPRLSHHILPSDTACCFRFLYQCELLSGRFVNDNEELVICPYIKYTSSQIQTT